MPAVYLGCLIVLYFSHRATMNELGNKYEDRDYRRIVIARTVTASSFSVATLNTIYLGISLFRTSSLIGTVMLVIAFFVCLLTFVTWIFVHDAHVEGEQMREFFSSKR